MEIIKKIFGVDSLLGDDEPQGELPETAQLYSEIVRFATPAVIDTVLVALVSMVDTMMVSRLGKIAIASVGICTQPRMIILATFTALNTGLTAVVARRRGEENREGAIRTFNQSFGFCMLLAFLISGLGFLVAEPFLKFAGATPEILGGSMAYFKTLMLGMPFNIGILALGGGQRGSGNTKIPMKVSMVANAVNIVFNYLLIGGNFGFPALGVAGAALATGIGNFAGFTMGILSFTMNKNSYLKLRLGEIFHFRIRVIRPVLTLGFSAGIEQLALRIGFFLYNRIIASLGTTAIATHNIGQNLSTLAFSFYDGMAMGAASLFGRAMGAKRNDLARVYLKGCQRAGLVVASAIMFVFTVFGKNIMLMFIDDPEIVFLGRGVLLIIAITAPLQSMQYILASCLRSAGDTRYTAMVSLICVSVFRPIMAYTLCYTLKGGLLGAWASYFIDQGFRFAFCHHRFKSGKWKKIKI